jgi:TnpA family transposase
VVNKLLALRNPRLWGEGASSCASDATKFESWKQNPMVEWRSRCKGYGVTINLLARRKMLSASTPN